MLYDVFGPIMLSKNLCELCIRCQQKSFLSFILVEEALLVLIWNGCGHIKTMLAKQTLHCYRIWFWSPNISLLIFQSPEGSLTRNAHAIVVCFTFLSFFFLLNFFQRCVYVKLTPIRHFFQSHKKIKKGRSHWCLCCIMLRLQINLLNIFFIKGKFW